MSASQPIHASGVGRQNTVGKWLELSPAGSTITKTSLNAKRSDRARALNRVLSSALEAFPLRQAPVPTRVLVAGTFVAGTTEEFVRETRGVSK